jgi:hypothetical protein
MYFNVKLNESMCSNFLELGMYFNVKLNKSMCSYAVENTPVLFMYVWPYLI